VKCLGADTVLQENCKDLSENCSNGIDGISIANAAALLNSTISTEAVIGMLTISVPIIALALVKGGEVAMSGVVSGLTAPANSAASSAANISAGVDLGPEMWREAMRQKGGGEAAQRALATDPGFRRQLAGAVAARHAHEAVSTGIDGQSLQQPESAAHMEKEGKGRVQTQRPIDQAAAMH
jgi:conjugal transfer mating pair stabilization protein TraG